MHSYLKKFTLVLVSLAIMSCKNNTNVEEAKFAKFETVKGTFKIEFRDDKAPNTCKRIKELVKSGFYNDILFHRVVPGFVVQAGDPEGIGSGGSGVNINAEFNDLKHIKGTVAMARKANDINSADSQFYVALGTFPHLDNQYTIFASVVEGMDVVEKISQGDKIIKAWLE